MMKELRDEELTDTDCSEQGCNGPGDDEPCEVIGCGGCFRPPVPPGPMAPPPAQYRCNE
jgi:hypothetical protein